jgi:hypothetical protein
MKGRILMKNGKKPTVKQRRLMCAWGLNAENWLVLAEEYCDNYKIAAWKAAVVDGDTIKADTWYMLKDGEFVEAEEQE